MDFKGITWAGNIYQKFEAMCLEVEEVMYEDTVKYMENQVQKVGVSVKKFYSEVMQDLLPACDADPVKVAAGDLSLNPYSHTELNKTKPIMSFSLEELKKKEITDRNLSDLSEDGSSFRAYNDLKIKRSGVYKRPMGIKRISRDNSPSIVCHDVASLLGDKNRLLLCDTSVTSSEPSVRNRPIEPENVNASLSGGSAHFLSSDKVELAESVMKEKQDHICTFCTSQKILSADSVRQEKDGSQCTSCYHGLTTNSIDVGGSACSDEPETEEVILCCEDNFGMEIIDNEEAVEPAENPELNETCVLVEEDEHNFVSQGTQKQESYKKKIHKALSSKFRSERKQAQSIFQYKDTGGKNNSTVVIPALEMEFDEGKFLVHEPVESDWELI
ncbi:diaminopimelate epimerase [Striga asiatica]|uniref:Diaminopimelate epimerase n=1 Tax=Striga asiatica TaxID=4170 RepID=A0A5A7RH18_STRAF|nr:diaminopimelate epimerase [Striga asiatica]